MAYEDEAKFQRLDQEIKRINKAIVAHPQTIVVTTRGDGTFTKKLVPGTYYVLMVSASQRHDTAAEYFGAIHLEKAVIKNDDVEVAAGFDL